MFSDIPRQISLSTIMVSLTIWILIIPVILLQNWIAPSIWLWAGVGVGALATIAVGAYITHRRANTISLDLARLQAYVDTYGTESDDGELPTSQFSEIQRTSDAMSQAADRLTEQIRALETTAYTDPITGLPNQVELDRVMETYLSGKRTIAPAAYIHLTLDGFTRAAEMIGSLAGHTLLDLAAKRLGEHLASLTKDREQTYTLAALQRETFGLFLPDGISRSDVSTIIRGLTAAMAAPFTVDTRHIQLGLAGGIAMAPEDGYTSDRLRKNAELALAQVRASEKGGFEFFTPRLDRLARGRIRLENELRSAVASRAFRPVYQPKICFKTGKIVGAEALARWQRSEGRIISPAAFIPIAEQLGLIEDVGEQILRAACKAAANWLQNGHEVALAVNVSPSQFQRENFTDTVIDAVRQAGLPPRWLELEITETMAVSDPARVADVMRPLRSMGVRLAIDDFGTGHANLSLLTQLPFDIFKIDRQFVSALQTDRAAPAIVEMILAMAETLGLETVAEGVETTSQADFLRRRGCTLGQGYLYSHGVPEKAFNALLANWDTSECSPRLKKVS